MKEGDCMRKGIMKFFAAGFLTLVAFNGIRVNAATTKVDGVTWNYTLSEGKATNVYAKDLAGSNLVIPEELNGYTIVSVGGGTQDTAMSNIASVSIPSSVKYINDYAFYGADLKNISLGVDDNIEKIGNSAFEECELSSVCIGSKVKSIGDSAFKNCNDMNKLNIYKFGGVVGNSAFENCSGLGTLFVGDVEELGEYAFKGCSGLENLEVNCKNLTTQFQDCSNLKNIVVGNEVDSIAASAFSIKLEGYMNIQGKELGNKFVDYVSTNENNVARSLINKEDYRTTLLEKGERNWFFKNPETELLHGNIEIVSGKSEQRTGKRTDGAYASILYTEKLYTLESSFFPVIETKVYDIEYEQQNGKVMGFAYYDCATVRDGYSLEYYNYADGCVMNNIYVECGNSGTNAPENLAESYEGTLYESIAGENIKIYNTKENSVVFPSYAPVFIAYIEATYDEAVIEGMQIDKSKISIVVKYSDNTSNTIVFDENIMNIEDKVIVIGENTIALTYAGLTCELKVNGVEQIPESNTSKSDVNLNDNVPSFEYPDNNTVNDKKPDTATQASNASAKKPGNVTKAPNASAKKPGNATKASNASAEKLGAATKTKSSAKKPGAATKTKSLAKKPGAATKAPNTSVKKPGTSTINTAVRVVTKYTFPQDNDIIVKDDVVESSSKKEEADQKSGSKSNSKVEEDTVPSQQEVTYESIESIDYADETRTEIPNAENKTERKSSKKGISPVIIVIAIALVVVVVGFILKRKNDDIDEDEFVKEEPEDEPEFIDED